MKFADAMLSAVLNELPSRAKEEPEVKAARRRVAEKTVYDACIADGMSVKFAEDSVQDLRRAWHTGDTVGMVTAMFFGGEIRA